MPYVTEQQFDAWLLENEGSCTHQTVPTPAAIMEIYKANEKILATVAKPPSGEFIFEIRPKD